MINNIDLVFVTSFYDKPLYGLCKHNNKLAKFSADHEEEGYTIYPLSSIEKIKCLINKKLFELCVGKHYTYKNNKPIDIFRWRKPIWLHKKLFNIYYKVKL